MRARSIKPFDEIVRVTLEYIESIGGIYVSKNVVTTITTTFIECFNTDEGSRADWSVDQWMKLRQALFKWVEKQADLASDTSS